MAVVSGIGLGGWLRAHLRRPPRGMTAVVWFGCIAGLLYVAGQPESGIRVTGYSQARTCEVASLRPGRLDSVAAQLQQDVEAGQVLATLSATDTTLGVQAAVAELARLEAERRRTAAALQRASAERAAGYHAELRRFNSDRDQAHLELLRAQASLAEEGSRLERLDIELQQLSELGNELIATDKLQDKRLQRDTVATRVQGYRDLVGEQRTLFERARQRAVEFAQTPQPEVDVAVELAPHDEAIAAQRARLAQLRVNEADLVLRAPSAGRVAAILRRPGEVVAPGQPVVMLVEREPSTVVAHLPEEYVTRVSAGTEARLYRRGNRGTAFESVVVFTGAEVERLPRRAEATSAVPRWGVPVHLACPVGQGFVAGEEVTVVFRATEVAHLARPAD